MGMVCSFSTISDESIEMVRKHPLLIKKWFCSEEEFEEFVKNKLSKQRGGFAKLFGKKPKPLPDYSPGGNENIRYDIDKAWHGIHFLLTGSAGEGKEPLNFLVAGGQKVKGCDLGYGPGCVFTSAQVKQIDEALRAISKEEFESRFDPDKMLKENIYPRIWDRPQEDDNTLGYLSEYFGELKQYIHRTAEQNMGMIVGLS